MKNRTRKLLFLLSGTIGIVALAIADISNNGEFTTGFLGMAVLILGTIIVPSVLDLLKRK